MPLKKPLDAGLQLDTYISFSEKKSELIRPIPLCCYLMVMLDMLTIKKKISEYGQEIPQSQTADKPMTPQRRATKSQGTRKTNRAKQPAISSQ